MQVHSSILSQEQSDVQIWDVKKKKKPAEKDLGQL